MNYYKLFTFYNTWLKKAFEYDIELKVSAPCLMFSTLYMYYIFHHLKSGNIIGEWIILIVLYNHKKIMIINLKNKMIKLITFMDYIELC